MRITRSYLLGVGSGLMLSLLFSISLSAIGLQDFSQLSKLVGLSKQNQPTSQENALSQPSQGLTVETSDSKGLGSVPTNSTVPSIIATTLSTATSTPTVPTAPAVPSTTSPKEPSIVKEAIQPLERQFVIPNGVSSERIAELLSGQGYITDRMKFLELVDKRGVAGKFQPGTYNLLPRLSYDEVLNRLMAKR
ncbi:MAG: hypothetical protein WA131_10430 [Desulfitobacteriaceae bacterium]